MLVKISYDKLWKILIDKKLKKYQLREMAQISSNSIAKMGKGEPVSLEILMKVCLVLQCDIGDICSFEREETDD